VQIFGNTYPTADGTTVRDYIHVADLAEGHLLALEYLETTPAAHNEAVNLGSGKGTSVLEMVRTAEKVLGREIETQMRDPRPGDPPTLFASIEKAKRLWGFSPKHDLESILRSALDWENRMESVLITNGYAMKESSTTATSVAKSPAV